MPALLVPASSRRLGDDTDRPPGTTLGSGERGVGLPGQVPINHPSLYISAPLFTTLLFCPCPPSSSSTIRITPPLCGKILDNTYKAWMRDDILKEMNVYFNFQFFLQFLVTLETWYPLDIWSKRHKTKRQKRGVLCDVAVSHSRKANEPNIYNLLLLDLALYKATLSYSLVSLVR